MSGSAVGATADTLHAAAKTIGRECAEPNLAYMKCKAKTDHPEMCLSQGYNVTACSNAVLKNLGGQCQEAFESYKFCLSRNMQRFPRCRKFEAALNECYNSIEG
ncbi:unnamed protein product [Chrysoparadoxa australica]